MAGKTRKSISKRLKFTRRGKMVRRPRGQDHLLAKRTGNARRRLHGTKTLSEREKRNVLRQLHY